jgi:acetylornithine deacetylase/succinyl-diaminopimelate desuccinylase-like protein
MGQGAVANMLTATVNIGTIQGNVKVNLIPATCVFEADIRLPIGLTRETMLAHIDDLLIGAVSTNTSIKWLRTFFLFLNYFHQKKAHPVPSAAYAGSSVPPSSPPIFFTDWTPQS